MKVTYDIALHRVQCYDNKGNRLFDVRFKSDKSIEVRAVEQGADTDGTLVVEPRASNQIVIRQGRSKR